jgi:pilus assembly protein CpaB
VLALPDGKPTSRSTLALALRSIADANAAEVKSDDPSSKRGDTINVVRYGVPSSTTTQK